MQRRWGVRVRVRVGGVRELDELDLAEAEGGGEVRGGRVGVKREGQLDLGCEISERLWLYFLWLHLLSLARTTLAMAILTMAILAMATLPRATLGWTTLVIQPSPSAAELTRAGSSFRLVLTSTTSPGHARSWVRAARSHGAAGCCCGLCDLCGLGGLCAGNGSVNVKRRQPRPTRRLGLG